MSVRLRLTLWYSAVLAVSLAFFGLSLYLVHGRLVRAEVDRSLAAQAAQVARSVQVIGLPPFVRQVILPNVDAFADAFTYMQVTDLRGRVVARSTNLGTQQLPLPSILGQNPAWPIGFTTGTVAGERLRIFVRPLLVGQQVVALLQVGRSLEALDLSLSRLRLALLAGGGVTLLAAGLLGWFLAGFALRPIDRITRAARRIGAASDLGERVAYAGPPDELGRLATTFNDMLARLETTYRELEEAHAAQRRFLADASHQLRTPLTVIRGNVDVLRRTGTGDPALTAEALADVAAEAEHMSRLVGDLLVLARADAGFHLEKAPVPLLPVLEDAVRRAARLAPGHTVALADPRPLEGAVVPGDREYLGQVFSLLLDNATRYTPAGGRVTVSGERGGGAVRVRVADDGPGIAPEDLPHIFERFYRGGGRTANGTGLGLAIARWIVEEHGGEIAAAGTPGRGATFTVTLPESPPGTGGAPGTSGD